MLPGGFRRVRSTKPSWRLSSLMNFPGIFLFSGCACLTRQRVMEGKLRDSSMSEKITAVVFLSRSGICLISKKRLSVRTPAAHVTKFVVFRGSRFLRVDLFSPKSGLTCSKPPASIVYLRVLLSHLFRCRSTPFGYGMLTYHT